MRCFCNLTLKRILERTLWKLAALHTDGKDPVNTISFANSPDSTPGALRLLRQKACAAKARGTAGSGNSRHVTDVAV